MDFQRKSNTIQVQQEGGIYIYVEVDMEDGGGQGDGQGGGQGGKQGVGQGGGQGDGLGFLETSNARTSAKRRRLSATDDCYWECKDCRITL